jgi:hypothetical protein
MVNADQVSMEKSQFFRFFIKMNKHELLPLIGESAESSANSALLLAAKATVD